MWWVDFIIGALAANGMPHFAFGVAGRIFRSPFGRHTRPLVNVAWGLTNFIVLTGLALWQALAFSLSAGDIGWCLGGFWLGVAMFAFLMPAFLPENSGAQS